MISSSSTSWDTIVIGAGPAGAVAAVCLSRAGRRVLLVEKKKFPRFKVCGCCLNPNALRILDQLDLSNHLRNAGAIEVDQFRLRSRGRELKIPMPGGVVISRQKMDVALVDAAVAAGAEFRDNVSALVMPSRESTSAIQVELTDAEGAVQIVEASAVLVADGLSGSALKLRDEFATTVAENSYFGMSAHLPSKTNPGIDPGTIEMATGRLGYVGSVVLEDGAINYSSAISPQARKDASSNGELLTMILEEAGSPIPVGFQDAEWHGAPLLSRHRSRFAAGSVLLLGDATGYVEPFTGEGMAWAVEMGYSAAELLLTPNIPETAYEASWTRTVEKLRAERHVWCRRLASFLRKPKLVSVGMVLGRFVPAVPGWIVSQLYESSQSPSNINDAQSITVSAQSCDRTPSASH
jgi:flavin-dependent dehydrogenase